MNSIERFTAALNQQAPDKIPIRVGNDNIFMTHYYRIGIRDYLENPELNAELFLKMVREFGLDSIKPGLGYILYGCGPYRIFGMHIASIRSERKAEWLRQIPAQPKMQ